MFITFFSYKKTLVLEGPINKKQIDAINLHMLGASTYYNDLGSGFSFIIYPSGYTYVSLIILLRGYIYLSFICILSACIILFRLLITFVILFYSLAIQAKFPTQSLMAWPCINNCSNFYLSLVLVMLFQH